MRRRGALLALALALGLSSLGTASCGKSSEGDDEIRIAAASDLTRAFEDLAKEYEKKTGKKVKLTFGSTGLLTKQIIDGAPFDLFAAANVSFAEEAVEKGGCDGSTQALYAIGRVVIYSKDAKVKGLDDLTDARFKKIAIANPEHAPYGKAAKQALESKGVWEAVKGKVVFGENVSQTLQYAQTGNADAAIVALSLVAGTEMPFTVVDDALHQPLKQALVVCGRGERAQGAKDFAAFINSVEGRETMKRYGFLLPGETLSARGGME